jgi:hypothetical protein
VVACTTTPDLPPVEQYDPAALSHLHYKAVLVAGDDSIPVFDNAVGDFEDRLVAARVGQSDIRRFSTARAVIDRDGVKTAALTRILADIADLQPGPGQGCIVYATSYGTAGRGLLLAQYREFLTPRALDGALARGCGNAPTVVIISACYSGAFAEPPMNRANRIILSAARSDRPSFGCKAGRQYTAYDRCLLSALDHVASWLDAYADTQRCVAREEMVAHFTPSEPQAFFGSAVTGMPIPKK